MICVIDKVDSEWSKKAKYVIFHCLRTLQKNKMIDYLYMKRVDSVILRNRMDNEKETLQGYYEFHKKRITIILDSKFLLTEGDIIYTFLHELGHHFCGEHTFFNQDYNPNKMNIEYCEEELKADSLARILLVKFFDRNIFKDIIENVDNRISFFKRKYKSLKNPNIWKKVISNDPWVSFTMNYSVKKENPTYSISFDNKNINPTSFSTRLIS